MTAPDHPHPGRPGRHAHVRRPQPATCAEPPLFLIGSPMGAGGFGTLAVALHRPHRRDLRPARRRAQRQGRPGQHVHARAARRRRASGHRGARRRPGRPVREQRRRRQRARARGGASGGRPDARRPRAAARGAGPGSGGRAGAPAGRSPTTTCSAASAPAWPSSSASCHTRARSRSSRRRAAGPRSGDVRDAGRGRRHPHRPAAVPEHHHLHPLRARLRGAARRVDPDRDRGRARVGGPAGLPRAAIAAAERLGTEAVRFPSDHGGFLGGEYGQAGDPDAFAAKLREVLAGG